MRSFILRSLPHPVARRKHKLPHLVAWFGYPAVMVATEPKEILWANLSRLMQHHWGRENLTRLAAEAKIGPGSCTRIKERKTSVGIDVLQKVASVFHLQAWHLLTPSLDPKNPPIVYLSERERELYERLREAARNLNGIAN